MRTEEYNNFSFSLTNQQKALLSEESPMIFGDQSYMVSPILRQNNSEKLNVSQPLDFTFQQINTMQKKHKIQKQKKKSNVNLGTDNIRANRFFQNFLKLQREVGDQNPAKNQNQIQQSIQYQNQTNINKKNELFSFCQESNNKNIVQDVDQFNNLCFLNDKRELERQQYFTPVQRYEFKEKIKRDLVHKSDKVQVLNLPIQFDFDEFVKTYNEEKFNDNFMECISPVFDSQITEQRHNIVQDSFLDLTPDFLNSFNNNSVQEKVAALKREALKYADNPNQFKGELLELTFTC